LQVLTMYSLPVEPLAYTPPLAEARKRSTDICERGILI